MCVRLCVCPRHFHFTLLCFAKQHCFASRSNTALLREATLLCFTKQSSVASILKIYTIVQNLNKGRLLSSLARFFLLSAKNWSKKIPPWFKEKIFVYRIKEIISFNTYFWVLCLQWLLYFTLLYFTFSFRLCWSASRGDAGVCLQRDGRLVGVTGRELAWHRPRSRFVVS